MKRIAGVLFVALVGLAAVLVGGCTSMSIESATKQRQVASVLAFLYPGKEDAPPVAAKVAEIKVPFRIGVAFVPDDIDPQFRLAESDRQRLSVAVQAAFAGYPFISNISTVPSMYLEPGGGFANLERVARLLNLDVVALISFDQMQHAGETGWSFLYWTGVGMYTVKGDQYDILTAVETVVLDIKSHRLLMRAAGISTIKGEATKVRLSEAAREARTRGFEEAVKDMIAKLHGEVKDFRERAPKDPAIRLILPPGYDPKAGVPSPAR